MAWCVGAGLNANHGFLDVSIEDTGEGLPGESGALKTADGGRSWVRLYAGRSSLTDLVATASSATAATGRDLIWTAEGLGPFAFPR